MLKNPAVSLLPLSVVTMGKVLDDLIGEVPDDKIGCSKSVDSRSIVLICSRSVDSQIDRLDLCSRFDSQSMKSD